MRQRRQYFFTNWGKQTLYVYLLHGFFIRFFRESTIQEYFSNTESFIMLACLSFLITVLLSSEMIATMAQPIIELKATKTKRFMIKTKEYIKQAF
jgi:fucose 4-O-acetylase-like acetyltransferase